MITLLLHFKKKLNDIPKIFIQEMQAPTQKLTEPEEQKLIPGEDMDMARFTDTCSRKGGHHLSFVFANFMVFPVLGISHSARVHLAVFLQALSRAKFVTAVLERHFSTHVFPAGEAADKNRCWNPNG